jgi:hypothetical protein
MQRGDFVLVPLCSAAPMSITSDDAHSEKLFMLTFAGTRNASSENLATL